MPDEFAGARAVADAVLYEGYVLYPYRASSAKNQTRWQFGVLMPSGFDDPSERSASRTEIVLEARPGARLRGEVRFLHVQHRTGGGLPEWDETVERSVVFDIAVDDARTDPIEVPFQFDSMESTVAGVRRATVEIRGAVVVGLVELPGPYGALRLRVDVRNRTAARPADRDRALRYALVAAHSMLAIESGRFLSMTEPPEWAAPEVEACTNEGSWPVLAGSERLLLCSPIILGDHPEIAPESPGDLYDSTEIDEILTLRTMTLTDAEKAEARATDPRAASVIDRVDALPPEQLDRLHGALRYLRQVERAPDDAITTLMTPDTPWWNPAADASVDPDHDHVVIDGVRVARGSRVRLHPGVRRTDAQDLFLHGHTATVEAVLSDVDGQQHLGVTPDHDAELAEIQRWHGRFLYFAPDEVSPL